MRSNTTKSLRKAEPKPRHMCQFPGCEERGEFPGPLHHVPESMRGEGWNGDHKTSNDRPLYCLKHIRQINQGWNFFDGMSADEIHAFERDALTGHRPLRESSKRVSQAHVNQAYRAAFHMRFGDDVPFPEMDESMSNTSIPAKIHEALAALGLSYPTDAKELKTAYRKLAKKYHPDHQLEDKRKQAEEHLKEINQAYHLLKDSEFIR